MTQSPNAILGGLVGRTGNGGSGTPVVHSCIAIANMEGGIMGGFILTVIDFAFATASCNAHRPTVAQQISMNFLNPPKGTRLIAESICRKNGKTSCVYHVNVKDDLGCDVAQAVVTGFKL